MVVNSLRSVYLDDTVIGQAFRIPWSLKRRFCYSLGQINSMSYAWMMAELICIFIRYWHSPNQFLITCVVFLDHEYTGFVILLTKICHVFTELCMKNEICIMAELICIILGCCYLPNKLMNAIFVFLDHENIGFVT